MAGTPAFLEALEPWALTWLPIIFMGLIADIEEIVRQERDIPSFEEALTREGLAPASGEEPVPAAD